MVKRKNGKPQRKQTQNLSNIIIHTNTHTHDCTPSGGFRGRQSPGVAWNWYGHAHIIIIIPWNWLFGRILFTGSDVKTTDIRCRAHGCRHQPPALRFTSDGLVKLDPGGEPTGGGGLSASNVYVSRACALPRNFSRAWDCLLVNHRPFPFRVNRFKQSLKQTAGRLTDDPDDGRIALCREVYLRTWCYFHNYGYHRRRREWIVQKKKNIRLFYARARVLHCISHHSYCSFNDTKFEKYSNIRIFLCRLLPHSLNSHKS